MEIIQKNNDADGLFIATENSAEAGRLFYSWSANGALIINHTETHPAYKGRGVGRSLVLAVVEYARKNEITIVPVCSYARSLFSKMPEIRDVL